MVLPRRFIEVSIPVFLIGASLLVVRVPDDFAKMALLASGLMVVDLLAGKAQRSIMRRALTYVIAAQVGYLWIVYQPDSVFGAYTEMIETLFFMLIAISFAVAVKFSPGRRKIEFELNATDYLLAFCLLAVLIVSKGDLWGAIGLSFIVQMIVIFYACELLITEKRSGGWNWLGIASMSAGLVLGVRGLW